MSKKIYTQSELYDALYKELSWRKKELKIFKDYIPQDESPKQMALLRASIPILYAHWEGFVKTACQYYLEYISNKEYVLLDLKTPFIAIALRDQLNKQSMNEIAERAKAVDYIINNLNQKLHLPTNDVIKTKSNLKFNVFEDICTILCLDIKDFEFKKASIDDLVDKRNTIAHGNNCMITYQLFKGYYEDTVQLLELLNTALSNAAVLEKHKKTCEI